MTGVQEQAGRRAVSSTHPATTPSVHGGVKLGSDGLKEASAACSFQQALNDYSSKEKS